MADTYSLADVRAMNPGAATYSLDDVRKMSQGPSFNEQMMKRETSDLSSNLRRGVRDVIDTGAEGLAFAFDKLTGKDPARGEYARVKQMNEAGKAEWRQANEGLILPHLQRLGGNMLGTAPFTAAVGVGVGAAGLPRLGSAITSGGMTTGGRAAPLVDIATRMAGGGINGYLTAGLVDPQSATAGGVIGAVAPPVIQGSAAALGAAGRAVHNLRTPSDVKLASDIAEMGGVNVGNLDELAQMRDALRQQGPTLLPGAEPTVPQILQSPGLSQLQRSVKATTPTALALRETEQSAARMGALNRIAPVSGSVQQAAEDVGSSIAGYAIPAEQQARKRVSALFDAIPSEQAKMQLPLSQMDAARAKFLGPGTFGKGAGAADAAIEEATAIGTRPAPAAVLDYSSSDLSRRAAGGHVHASGPVEPQPVPFDQLQRLRSSIGEAITAADKNGQAQAKAALTAMKNAIDNKVADVAAGNILPGEVFTPQAIDAWGQALNAHAAKKLQFNTGPQASIFRNGADGMPQIQGAEIPGKFFGSSRSQVENAQAFRRLVGDDPGLMGDLRRYAVTDAAGQVDQFGHLTNAKFNRWLAARSGATGEIFNESQRATLKAIADDLRRSAVAENLGRSTGSDTAQKAANMMRLGLMDSPALNIAASRIPGGRSALDFFRGPAQVARAERIGGLLADPGRVGGLLDTFIARQQPKPQGLLSGAIDPLLYRTSPLLLTGGGQ